VLENPSEKILLLSSDPNDASFLAEIAIAQQSGLEIAVSETDLCVKIADARNGNRLLAVFVDVTEPDSLRKFEFALQSKMGVSLAMELAPMIHYVSGNALALNREILQSPYFSFYSERKPYDYRKSSELYEQSYALISEIKTGAKLSFDHQGIENSFEVLKKEFLQKGASVEWALRFKKVYTEVIETLFPARFDIGYSFSDGIMRFVFTAPARLDRERFRIEKLLEFGVSASIGSNDMVLFVPVFMKAEHARESFRFYKIER